MTSPRSDQCGCVRQAHLVLLAFGFAIVLCGFAGYQTLFSTFASYDDEGYVMISLASFIQGHPLYDETYTQYGPAYYQVTATIHRLLGLPVNHTVVRLKTLTVWLLVALAGSAIVWRLCGSRWIALAAFVLGFFHLDKLCLEPGHPQELCLLYVMLVTLCTTYAGPKQQPFLMIGTLCGIALMTKLNVGVFLALSLGAAVASRISSTRLRRITLVAAAFATVCLLLAMYHRHWFEPGATTFPLVCLLSFVLVLGRARSKLSPSSMAGDLRNQGTIDSQIPAAPTASLIWLVASTLLTVGVIAAITIVSGTSMTGLKHGMLGQHSGFTARFFHAVELWWFATPLLVICGFTVFRHHVATLKSRDDAAAATTQDNHARGRQLELAVPALLAALALPFIAGTQLFESWEPLTHGLHERGQHLLLLSLGLPMCWAVIQSPSEASEFGIANCQNSKFARTALASIATLQPLIAFPTPGTQVALGTLPLLLVALVLVADGWRIAHESLALSATRRIDWRVFPTVGVVFLLALLVGRGFATYTYRQSRIPLALPGAECLRLEADFVKAQRWLVDQIRENGDTFLFTQHGRNSLYFWAQLPPPSALNATFWPFLLNSRQQNEIIRSLDRFDRVCVIHEPHFKDVPSGPLVDAFRDLIPVSKLTPQRRRKDEAVADNSTPELWILSEGL